MWLTSIPDGRGWTFLWSGRILCSCGGIRRVETMCPACDAPPYDCSSRKISLDNGSEIEVPPAFMGAEGRYEDYLYLQMMEREWKRSSAPAPDMLSGASEKIAVVLLFWTYFETRIERLLRVGLKGTPRALAEDTLERYSSIGSRLEKLYKVLFGATYEKYLKDSGFGDLALHLKEVQRRRNEFMHGNPKAIDDEFVLKVVELIGDEHEAWIHLFNKRIRALRGDVT